MGQCNHAGWIQQIYTSAGKCWVQKGKDLRRISRVIGTGGYLAHRPQARLYEPLGTGLTAVGEQLLLLPQAPQCYRDRSYLFTLLGNLAKSHRRQAVRLALASLEKVEP